MKNLSQFTFKQYSNKYVEDLQHIFLVSFGKKMSKEYLMAKYDTSLFGFNPIATIAYEKQKPVAFYGAIPQIFKQNDSRFNVAHACDSFTDPNYHRRGLHHNLALKSYELMAKQDIKMVYAYHSENTFRSTKKLGWKEHITMGRFHVKNNGFPFGKVYDKLMPKQQRAKALTKKVKEQQVPLTYLPYINKRRAQQDYTSHFLNYKNSFNPHFILELNECVFYLKFDVVIMVGYMFYESAENLKLGLARLKKLQKSLGYNETLFQLDSSTNQYKDLKSIIPPLPSWKVGYLAFDSELKIEDFIFNYADLDTF